ncbi:hypothetical protein JCM19301_1075 [Jejuia pallidilutea]|nr:hypothetical protein JCM19301_1075 [Jejuia pallidilutea]GAL73067.1 hypothetical protein JCM19302_246 [Jejuia pallidilutea]
MLGMFFIILISCKDNFKEVQKIGISENEPIGVAENINLKYTDSGKVKAILKSPKMFDYSNRKFAYNEFTEGVNLELFEDGKKSVVVSDYAIIYNKTNIIDLQGNVKITTHSNDTLFAEQLYYDQEKEWLFTNKPVTFRTGSDLINGNGFDSNYKFTNAEVLEITGLITVNE